MYLNELQDKVCVFAVEFCGQAVQAAAQSFLLHRHQILAFSGQLHTHAKLTLPEEGKVKIQQDLITRGKVI